MSTHRNCLRSVSAAYRRLSIRRVMGCTLLMAGALLLLMSHRTCTAQIPADAIPQLEMLDTTVDDLIRLSTTYADSLRELKSARLSIETVQALRPTAVVTNLEVQIANLNLEAAERKVQVLRAIVEKQLTAAENKLQIVVYFEERLGAQNGRNPAPAAQERSTFLRANSEATVQILKMILAMN